MLVACVAMFPETFTWYYNGAEASGFLAQCMIGAIGGWGFGTLMSVALIVAHRLCDTRKNHADGYVMGTFLTTIAGWNALCPWYNKWLTENSGL